VNVHFSSYALDREGLAEGSQEGSPSTIDASDESLFVEIYQTFSIDLFRIIAKAVDLARRIS
jgi:hypothetical protein